jgi:polar amino acid transport system substrate-binding protein
MMLGLALVIFITGPARGEDIVIGRMDENYEKFAYFEDGRHKGVLVDIARRTFANMGISVRFKPLRWSRLLEDMRSNNLDAIIAVFRTEERDGFMHFPDEPHTYETNHLILPAKSSLAFKGELNVLNGLRIGVVRGWSYGKKFDEWAGFDKIPMHDQGKIIENIVQGRIHAGVGVLGDMQQIVNDRGIGNKIRFAKKPVFKIPSYLAFSKKQGHDTLARRFSDALTSFKKTQEFSDIFTNYGLSPP